MAPEWILDELNVSNGGLPNLKKGVSSSIPESIVWINDHFKFHSNQSVAQGQEGIDQDNEEQKVLNSLKCTKDKLNDNTESLVYHEVLEEFE